MLPVQVVNRTLSSRQIYASVGSINQIDQADCISAVGINPKFHVIGFCGSQRGSICVTVLTNNVRTKIRDKLIEKVHDDVVTDLKWNHFNDNVLASASADCTIKIWNVTDELKISCVRKLSKHSKAVKMLRWHSTVDNLLLSYGEDGKLLLWNLLKNQIIFEIQEDSLSDIGFSINSSFIGCLSVSEPKLKILNSRTGGVTHNITLPLAKPMKVQFLSNERVFVLGCSKTERRQLIAYSVFFLPSPLYTLDIDDYIGEFQHVYDFDLRLLYLSGKDYPTIKVYELNEKYPWYKIVLDYEVKGMSCSQITKMPKRGLLLTELEVMRLYNHSDECSSFQEISFRISKDNNDNTKLEAYPSTFGPTPATSSAEWLAGIDANPILLELKPGFPVVTTKPVELSEDQDGKELITSQHNIDRKFRFLSQVTKPDYRIIDERDDCEQIRLVEQVKQKLQSSTESFDTNENEIAKGAVSDSSLPSERAESSSEKILSSEKNNDNLLKSSIVDFDDQVTESTNLCADISNLDEIEEALLDLESLGSNEERLEDDSERNEIAPIETPEDLEPEAVEIEQQDESNSISEVIDPLQMADSHEIPSQMRTAENPLSQTIVRSRLEERTRSMSIPIPSSNGLNSIMTPPLQFVERLHISSSPKSAEEINSSFGSSVTSDCRIEAMSSPIAESRRRPVDEPLDVGTNPFKGCFDDPEPIIVTSRVNTFAETARTGYKTVRTSSSEEENGNDRKLSLTSDTSNSYSTDGHRLLENTIDMLEVHLSRSDNKVRQLERICELQQKDMDSLRYEIEWKDQRIDFLQKALVDLESRMSSSTSSDPTVAEDGTK